MQTICCALALMYYKKSSVRPKIKMFLIKLCAVELVATLLGALTTLHTDLKTLRLDEAYTVEGIRIETIRFISLLQPHIEIVR
jgi:hypothetical protein